jgi:hypothetical protein
VCDAHLSSIYLVQQNQVCYIFKHHADYLNFCQSTISSAKKVAKVIDEALVLTSHFIPEQNEIMFIEVVFESRDIEMGISNCSPHCSRKQPQNTTGFLFYSTLQFLALLQFWWFA